MSISFVGLNHKTASVEIREQVAFKEREIPDALEKLLAYPGVREAVVLSTCNRTEVYAEVEDGHDSFDLISDFMASYHDIPQRDLLPHLYTGEELDAVMHLFNVASSLDSLVLGEQQILGQVRKAYRIASEADATGKVLNKLFHQALSVGKGVRAETDISKSHVSLSTVAVDLAKRVFDDLENRTVLVLGAGEMSELTARYLAENGVASILVANRTHDRALLLANELNGQAMRFDDLETGLALADIVISSTAAPGYIMHPDMIERARRKRRGRMLLIVDLALPRDIDPACGDFEDVFVYSIDDLHGIAQENQASRELAAQEAARMVSDEAGSFACWLEVCDVTPTIKDLRGHAEEIRDHELAHLFKKLGEVDEKDRDHITAAMNAVINKLLHDPIVTLRDRAGDMESAECVRDVRDIFNLDGTRDVRGSNGHIR